MKPAEDITRREFVGAAAVALTISGAATDLALAAPSASGLVHCSLTINAQRQELDLDPRVSLLDLLRERLQLTGTKKGCDHGQCGACTVIVNGARVNSCLTLAVTQDGNSITTIEGLAPQAANPEVTASGAGLHPMQAAFIERDGFQCGFCTSGQICSAVAMLNEWRSGTPSAVSLTGAKGPLTDGEIRERMAGNICRCGAYPNIIAAVRDVHQQTNAELAR